MRKIKLLTSASCLLSALLLTASGVIAEDIDLFSGINPSGGNPPTVLLGWHSTANSNANVVHGCVYSDNNQAPELGDTVGGMEQCALVNTMLSLKEDANSSLLGAVKVGLMWIQTCEDPYRSCLNPGKVTSRVTVPPPTYSLRSTTKTLSPYLVSSEAHASPLCPPPAITTSKSAIVR